MQVGTYPTRNFATLEPSGLQLPFAWRFSVKPYGESSTELSFHSLTYRMVRDSQFKDCEATKALLRPSALPSPRRAGVRPNTSSYDLAKSCVFNKQSPPPC